MAHDTSERAGGRSLLRSKVKRWSKAGVLAGASVMLGAACILSACNAQSGVTITVVCTDEMRETLADANITDAEAWLKQAGEAFAAQYTDSEVTVAVITQSPEVLENNLYENDAESEGFSFSSLFGKAYADEDDTASGENAASAAEGDTATASDDAQAGGTTSDNGSADPGTTEGSQSETAGQTGTSTENNTSNAAEEAANGTTGTSSSAAPSSNLGDGTRPDVVFGAYEDIAPALYSGKAVALDDIAASLQSEYPAAYLSAGTSPRDGATYLLPYSVNQMILVFDEDLFRACGLDAYITDGDVELGDTVESAVQAVKDNATIQTWSPDGWREVLSTLASTLPQVSKDRQLAALVEWNAADEQVRKAAREAGEDEDAASAAANLGDEPVEVPLYAMAMYGSGTEGASFTLALMRMFNAAFYDSDGYVSLENTEGKDAVEWLRRVADAGCFPDEYATLTYDDCAELFAQGQLAIFPVDSSQLDELLGQAVQEVEVTVEPDEAEGEEGETAQAVTETQIQQVRHYGFVTLPLWSSAFMPGVMLPLGDDMPEGYSEGDTWYTGMLPSSFSGFAVLDNGDDATVAAAKAFVEFVLTSDEWLAYSATTTQMPAVSRVMESYQSQITLGAQLAENTDKALNLSGNVPEWGLVQEAFVQSFSSALAESKTPTEATAAINRACNLVLDADYQAADLRKH